MELQMEDRGEVRGVERGHECSLDWRVESPG